MNGQQFVAELVAEDRLAVHSGCFPDLRDWVRRGRRSRRPCAATVTGARSPLRLLDTRRVVAARAVWSPARTFVRQSRYRRSAPSVDGLGTAIAAVPRRGDTPAGAHLASDVARSPRVVALDSRFGGSGPSEPRPAPPVFGNPHLE
jgi:hypothetical protein